MANFRQVTPSVKIQGSTISASYTGTAGLTAVTGASLVMVCATTDCHIRVGSAPTAVSTDFFLPAKTVIYLTCNPTDKISAIQDASGGTIFVNPCG
jgi:hypothetical protein